MGGGGGERSHRLKLDFKLGGVWHWHIYINPPGAKGH